MFLKHHSLEYIKGDDFYEIGRKLGEEINLKTNISRATRSLYIFKTTVSKIKRVTERQIT